MKLIHSSGWLELLGIIAGYESFTKRFVSRLGATKTLSRLLWDENAGPTAGPLLRRFLPPSLEFVLKERGPDAMLKLFDKDSETPEIIWNGEMRSELRNALAKQLDSFVKGRTEPNAETEEFHLSIDAGATYKNLEDELCIGGVYVRLFLKEPTFNLRDPTGFLEKLMIRWTHELEVYTSPAKHSRGESSEPRVGNGAVTEAQQDVLQLVTSASVYLCKVRDSLCDKLAQWGYMAKGIALLHDVLECDLLGAPLLSIMRIFHVASNRQVNVEALALAGGSDGKSGIVYYTMQAIGKDPLHMDSAFMLEVLLKVYRKALGDVKKASKAPTEFKMSQQHNGPTTSVSTGSYAHAPSPAPGLEPVRKSAANKTKIEHPLDHPLAFGGPSGVPQSNQTTQTLNQMHASRSSRQQSARQPNYGSVPPGCEHPLVSSVGTPAYSMNQGQSALPTSYGVPSSQSGAVRGPSAAPYGGSAVHGNASMGSSTPVQQQATHAPAHTQRMIPNPLAQWSQNSTAQSYISTTVTPTHYSTNTKTTSIHPQPSQLPTPGLDVGMQQHSFRAGRVPVQPATAPPVSFVPQQVTGPQEGQSYPPDQPHAGGARIQRAAGTSQQPIIASRSSAELIMFLLFLPRIRSLRMGYSKQPCSRVGKCTQHHNLKEVVLKLIFPRPRSVRSRHRARQCSKVAKCFLIQPTNKLPLDMECIKRWDRAIAK